MTDTRWTPGPWHVEGDDGEFLWGHVVVAEKREIECEGRNADEARANTYLVAAAPELYELLSAMAEYMSDIPESAAGGDDYAVSLCRKANAVLKKARNE